MNSCESHSPRISQVIDKIPSEIESLLVILSSSVIAIVSRIHQSNSLYTLAINHS